jgi:hypothetical protein
MEIKKSKIWEGTTRSEYDLVGEKKILCQEGCFDTLSHLVKEVEECREWTGSVPECRVACFYDHPTPENLEDLKKIRRRVEDYLRKADPAWTMRVASLLGVRGINS